MQKFDRVAYRKKYDQTYFKKTVQCPRCGETKVKHMLSRHMRTRKCRDHPDLAEPFDVCSAVYAVCSYCLVPFKILWSWFDC